MYCFFWGLAWWLVVEFCLISLPPPVLLGPSTKTDPNLVRRFEIELLKRYVWWVSRFFVSLPETNSLPPKMVASNRNFLLQGSIFRAYVGFGEGNLQTEGEGSFAGDFCCRWLIYAEHYPGIIPQEGRYSTTYPNGCEFSPEPLLFKYRPATSLNHCSPQVGVKVKLKYLTQLISSYCWWKKSCTAWDVRKTL